MHIASNSTFLRIWRRCAFLWKGWFAKNVHFTVFLENFPPDKNAHRLQILKNVEFEAMCIFVERLICKKCAFYIVKCTFLEKFPPDKNAHHLKILKNSRFWRVMCKKCAFYGVKCIFLQISFPTKMHIKNAHTNGTFQKMHIAKKSIITKVKIWDRQKANHKSPALDITPLMSSPHAPCFLRVQYFKRMEHLSRMGLV